jgi:hypothetical protein
MAEGHGWGGASRTGSNHPALASACAAPPYPRRELFLVLMSPCIPLMKTADLHEFCIPCHYCLTHPLEHPVPSDN